jgi:hypothetical protein
MKSTNAYPPLLLNWHLAAYPKLNVFSGEANGAAKLVSELVHSPGMKEFLLWFSREKQWISEQHLQLCRIP